MNSPSCSIHDCQGRPVSENQRRNSAIEPAYALVVDSAPSSTSPQTASSPETPASLIPDLALICMNNYQPRAPLPRRRAAELARRPVQATSRNKLASPGEPRTTGLIHRASSPMV